jgi:hypothetical protein
MKPFSWTLDKIVGLPAERKVEEYLECLDGVQQVIHRPFGLCDVDIAVMRWTQLYYVEVERRKNWKVGDFPYDTIHIPGRKEGILRVRNPLLYYVVRDDLQRAAVLRGEQILSSNTVANYNRLMMDVLDKFFDVPKTEIIGYENL